MKAMDKIRETVNDPAFCRGAQTAALVGCGVIFGGSLLYMHGYFKGSAEALSAIDRGFKAADPEAYSKLLEKATHLVKTGAIK